MSDSFIELVRDRDSWTIQIRAFSEFRDALGHDVLTAFCRCFVHADRLMSMTSFFETSESVYGKDSPAFGRDLLTSVWFSVGTLRELALAIRPLRTALRQRGILEADAPPWLRLRELERRWEDDAAYRKMRDIAAFHVDSEVIARGLDQLTADMPDVELCRGHGRENLRSSLTLGVVSQLNGLAMDLNAYGAFVDAVTADSIMVSNTLQEAFITAAQRAGIGFKA